MKRILDIIFAPFSSIVIFLVFVCFDYVTIKEINLFGDFIFWIFILYAAAVIYYINIKKKLKIRRNTTDGYFYLELINFFLVQWLIINRVECGISFKYACTYYASFSLMDLACEFNNYGIFKKQILLPTLLAITSLCLSLNFVFVYIDVQTNNATTDFLWYMVMCINIFSFSSFLDRIKKVHKEIMEELSSDDVENNKEPLIKE